MATTRQFIYNDGTIITNNSNNEVTRVCLIGFEECINLPNDFLGWYVSLKTIDLSSLVNVTTIGDGFMRVCVYLESIDLSPLSNVTSIGNNFICDYRDLKHIYNKESIKVSCDDFMTNDIIDFN